MTLADLIAEAGTCAFIILIGWITTWTIIRRVGLRVEERIYLVPATQRWWIIISFLMMISGSAGILSAIIGFVFQFPVLTRDVIRIVITLILILYLFGPKDPPRRKKRHWVRRLVPRTNPT